LYLLSTPGFRTAVEDDENYHKIDTNARSILRKKSSVGYMPTTRGIISSFRFRDGGR
jgi:hypothetical protein